MIDTSVLATVHHVFHKIHEKPVAEIGSRLHEQRLQAVNAKLEGLKIEKVRLERQNNHLRQELLKSINGEKSVDKDMLSSFVIETKSALQIVCAQIEEAENEKRESASESASLQQAYSTFLGRETEFQNASMPVRKMILTNIIERITVDRQYNISIKLHLTARQFVEGF